MATDGGLLDQVAGAEAAGSLSAPAAGNIPRWLAAPPFAQARDRLAEDIRAGRWETLDNGFYAVLEFGTGGRRGRMSPVGTNVLNERTIGQRPRGLPDYLIRRKGTDAPKSCAIA